MLKQLTMALLRFHPQVEAVAANSCTVRVKGVDRGNPEDPRDQGLGCLLADGHWILGFPGAQSARGGLGSAFTSPPPPQCSGLRSPSAETQPWPNAALTLTWMHLLAPRGSQAPTLSFCSGHITTLPANPANDECQACNSNHPVIQLSSQTGLEYQP